MNTQTRAASDPAAGKSRRPDGHRVLEALGEAVYVVDRERRCSYANPAGLRLLGLERPEQLLGQDMHEVLHVRQAVNATEHDSSECPITRALLRGTETHISQVARPGAGSSDVSIRAYPLASASGAARLRRAQPIAGGAGPFEGPEVYRGRTDAVVLVGVDLGNYRQPHEQDVFRKVLLDAQTEASIDGILVVSSDTKMLSFNRRFVEMWGVPQDIVDSRSDELALAWVLRTLQDPDAFLARVAYLYQHPDEESRDLIPLKDGRTFDRYSAPVKSRDGVYYGRVWFFRDVTELKRAEAELARLYQEAQEAIRVRDEFLSIASHELRTPLTSLQLQIQGIQRKLGRTSDTGVSTPWITERITSAFDLVAGLSRLIGNLLDISRITSKRIVLEDEGFDLSAMVTEVVHRHAEQFADAGCTVRIHAADPLPGRWDRMRLDQVLTNLLTNASKYGRGAPVDIAVGGDGPSVWITVRDQGIGIDPKDRERIFLRFERAVSSNHYGGFGLGLWIVREIVGLMGGDITVESAPGQGAEFRVTLPLRRQVPAEAAEASP